MPLMTLQQWTGRHALVERIAAARRLKCGVGARVPILRVVTGLNGTNPWEHTHDREMKLASCTRA